MRPLALTVALLACCFSARAGAAPAARSVSSVSHGIRITLSTSIGPYHRDYFVDALVRVTNVTHRTIHLYGYPATCWWNGYAGLNPLVLVKATSGEILFPPRPSARAHCPATHPFPLPGGVTRAQMLYVPARGPWLQAVARVVSGGHTVTIHSPSLKIRIR